MIFLLYITIILLLPYAMLIRFYHKHWKALNNFEAADTLTFQPSIKFSVIIPARNEAENIYNCVQAIIQQNYPQHLYEVIVVDDFSTDETAAIVKEFTQSNIKLIQLANHVSAPLNSYKKKAIEIGISLATGDWIITTDADCNMQNNWLHSIAAYQQKTNAVFIAAPVKMQLHKSILGYFQSLDFLILQGITGASVHARKHSMCNGANLAYDKAAFNTVNGFAGIDTIASGDDMLLIHKIATAYPQQYFFLKSTAAIVTTQPEKNWHGFFNQRIRWASKAGKYDDKNIFWVLLLVYLLNVCLLACFITAFFQPVFFWFSLVLLFVKTMIEYAFVKAATNFFSLQQLLNYFLFLQPLHIVYTVIAGFLGQMGTYTWKGRTVK